MFIKVFLNCWTQIRFDSSKFWNRLITGIRRRWSYGNNVKNKADIERTFVYLARPMFWLMSPVFIVSSHISFSGTSHTRPFSFARWEIIAESVGEIHDWYFPIFVCNDTWWEDTKAISVEIMIFWVKQSHHSKSLSSKVKTHL